MSGVMNKSTEMDEICRECIPCDGGCGRTDPSNKCERCHLSYYCSKKCQKKHWKDHREGCLGVDGIRRLAFPTCTIPLEGTNTDCAICFSATAIDPLVLDCRHAFCVSCLSEYQELMCNYDEQIDCPLCRNPNVPSAPLDHILLLASRADKKEPGDEREHRFQEVLDLLSKAIIGSHANDHRMLYLQAKILLLKGDPDQALLVLRTLIGWDEQGVEKAPVIMERFDRVLELKLAGREDEAKQLLDGIEGYQQILNVKRKRDMAVQLLIAEAHEANSDWDIAIDVYRGIFVILSNDTSALVQLRKAYMGMYRGYYETGEYDEAIAFGDAVLRCFRQFPGVHKYVALSHKQKGNLEEAQAVMNRAVLYETPWDDSNRQQNYDLWKELVASADS